LLGWLGVAALQHGNVIEVATGNVGIDKACSGIRSFQATLMISLFLGKLYRLNMTRRLRVSKTQRRDILAALARRGELLALFARRTGLKY
jgi:hypothetical protein